MKTVPITKGRIVIVDDCDFEWVTKNKWSGKRYASRKITENGIKRHIWMHRIIAGALPGQLVDHINGDILDNRRSNLRICTHAENMRNRKAHKNKTTAGSAYAGVRNRRRGLKPWQGYITKDGKNYINHFSTEIEAARWRDFMAIELFGDFARMNLPDSREVYAATHSGQLLHEACLAKSKTKYDHALILEYIANHTYAQAARRFGCCPSTVTDVKRKAERHQLSAS